MKQKQRNSYLIMTLAMLSWPLGESIAAEHLIEMTAEKKSGGSTGDDLLAYKMTSHSVDGSDITSRYSTEATIPGPTLVLTEGDTVRLAYSTETGHPVHSKLDSRSVATRGLFFTPDLLV